MTRRRPTRARAGELGPRCRPRLGRARRHVRRVQHRCARLECRLSTTFNLRDVSWDNLLTVVERLLALPGP